MTKNDALTYPASLSKFLSVSGVASRRKSTELIKEGKIKVNGKVTLEPGLKVEENDTIEHNGKKVCYGKRYHIMLNKPRGYVCTSEDQHAKKKAIDLINIEGARLFTAGRLDKDSEGLIIVTNDGEYAAKLTHPKYQTQKTYIVTTDQSLSKEDIQRFKSGVEDNGEVLVAKNVEEKSRNVYIFTLTQGKNREIRRLVASAGRRTLRLKRVATGKLKLNDLEPGKWRFLSEEEIALSLTK